jgi:hypothetical protein
MSDTVDEAVASMAKALHNNEELMLIRYGIIFLTFERNCYEYYYSCTSTMVETYY